MDTQHVGIAWQEGDAGLLFLMSENSCKHPDSGESAEEDILHPIEDSPSHFESAREVVGIRNSLLRHISSVSDDTAKPDLAILTTPGADSKSVREPAVR